MAEEIKRISDDNGGYYVYTCSTEGDKITLDYMHELGPNAQPNYVGEKRTIVIKSDNIKVSGHTHTGISFEDTVFSVNSTGDIVFPALDVIKPQPLQLKKGTPYGGDYGDPAYYIQHGRVFLEGLAKGNYVEGDVVTTLPSGARPAAIVSRFVGTTYTQGVRVNIYPDGRIVVLGNCSYVFLDGLDFRKA